MKRLILAAALSLTAVGALAQGQFTFGNRNLNTDPPLDAKVLSNTGTALDATYLAQAYVGLSADSLAAVGQAVAFRSGAGAGYIPAEVVTTSFAGGSMVQVQMRAWEAAGGASYEAALAAGKLVGESNIIPLTVAIAPNPPPAMVGLQGFSLVPEPSTMALGVLGVAALLLRRRS